MLAATFLILGVASLFAALLRADIFQPRRDPWVWFALAVAFFIAAVWSA